MIIVTKFLRSCCPQATVGRNSSKDRWHFAAAATEVFSPESGPPICGLMSRCPSQRVAEKDSPAQTGSDKTVAKRLQLLTLPRRSPSPHAVACEGSVDVRLDC